MTAPGAGGVEVDEIGAGTREAVDEAAFFGEGTVAGEVGLVVEDVYLMVSETKDRQCETPDRCCGRLGRVIEGLLGVLYGGRFGNGWRVDCISIPVNARDAD